MNCAPAAIFFASRNGRHSKGGANGFSAAPKNTRGAKVTLRPLWNRCASRSVVPISSSVMQSRSNTGLACGWSPLPTPSPVRHSMLHTPIAAPPRMSPWIAMRLRSRHEICITGA